MKAIKAEIREQIRRDYESGATYAELARKHHVSKGTVFNVINQPDPPASKSARQNFVTGLQPRQVLQDFAPRVSEPEHYWPHQTVDITPGRNKTRRQPPQLERDERGRFLPRGSESTTLARREPTH